MYTNYRIIRFRRHDRKYVANYNMLLGTIPYRYLKTRIIAFTGFL
jgi:hypothetical protein